MVAGEGCSATRRNTSATTRRRRRVRLPTTTACRWRWRQRLFDETSATRESSALSEVGRPVDAQSATAMDRRHAKELLKRKTRRKPPRSDRTLPRHRRQGDQPGAGRHHRTARASSAVLQPRRSSIGRRPRSADPRTKRSDDADGAAARRAEVLGAIARWRSRATLQRRATCLPEPSRRRRRSRSEHHFRRDAQR